MRVASKYRIDPDSFRTVESASIHPAQFVLAIPEGLVDARMVVFFTFIIGGMFMVLRRPGIIAVGVSPISSSMPVQLAPDLYFSSIKDAIG